jgi:capsular exopolysaccharide synthesis family protein
MEPHTREAYRRLAAELHHQQLERGCKVVMVTSALPQEGKTLTVLNLALTLSESFARQVLLVDADLRRPTLHGAFSLPVAPGLRDALRGDGRAHVVSVRPRLALLPAGTPNDDPMEALTSASMRELLHDARGTYDWLLVDTAPVGLLPDANLLASMVDSAIIVVAAAKTDYTLVQRAIDELGADRVLGVVLNRAQRPSRQYQDDSHRDHATPS